VTTFKRWAASSASDGVLRAYSQPTSAAEHAAWPDYPPLSVVILAGTATALDTVAGAADIDSTLFTIAVKLPGLLARLLFVIVFAGLATRWSGDPRTATAVILMFWLNPVLWLNGAALGYLDPLCWTAGLAGMIAASSGRFFGAAVLVASAALIKPQGVFFFLPVAIAAWGSWPRVWGATSAAVVTAATVIGPFVAVSGAEGFIDAMGVNALDDNLSGYGLNPWWIVTAAFHGLEHGSELLRVPLEWMPESEFAQKTGLLPRSWMIVLVAGIGARAGWMVRGARGMRELAAATAVLIHAYTVFAISVHENHAVYVVVTLAVATLFDPRYRRLFLAMSALVFANHFLFYGVSPGLLEVPHTGWFLPITVLLSVANAALLGFHWRLFRNVASSAPGARDVLQRSLATAISRLQTSPTPIRHA
jgi:hypothetical protein